MNFTRAQVSSASFACRHDSRCREMKRWCRRAGCPTDKARPQENKKPWPGADVQHQSTGIRGVHESPILRPGFTTVLSPVDRLITCTIFLLFYSNNQIAGIPATGMFMAVCISVCIAVFMSV